MSVQIRVIPAPYEKGKGESWTIKNKTLEEVMGIIKPFVEEKFEVKR